MENRSNIWKLIGFQTWTWLSRWQSINAINRARYKSQMGHNNDESSSNSANVWFVEGPTCAKKCHAKTYVACSLDSKFT